MFRLPNIDAMYKDMAKALPNRVHCESCGRVAAHPEDHTDDYLRATLKAAKDRKRRWKTARIDNAIASLEAALSRHHMDRLNTRLRSIA